MKTFFETTILHKPAFELWTRQQIARTESAQHFDRYVQQLEMAEKVGPCSLSDVMLRESALSLASAMRLAYTVPLTS